MITSTTTREEIAALLGPRELYSPARDTLYTVNELMQGFSMDAPLNSRDARIAAHVKASGIPPSDIDEAIAQVVHDQGVDAAMRAYVADAIGHGEHIVGIMGGASAARDASAYGLAARTAKALTEAGYRIATGGGLGIMEAGNLGACFAGASDEQLDAAITQLATVPSYPGNEAAYFASAHAAAKAAPGTGRSLAVATWRYDAEPISQFATHIAKLFQNPVREDGLLAIADAGVVFFAGGFGTVQEIFQDLAQNGYAAAAARSPMVFADTAEYDRPNSEWPVVKARAARGKPPFDELIALADTPERVLDAIARHRR